MIHRSAFGKPETVDPAWGFSFLYGELFEFAGVEPNAAALVAGVDQHFFKLAFVQGAVATRASHRRRAGRFRFLRHLQLRAQLLDRLLVLTMKIFFLKTATTVVHSV